LGEALPVQPLLGTWLKAEQMFLLLTVVTQSVLLYNVVN
jgi:hypothetical protein